MNTAPASTQPSGPITSELVVSPDFGAANDCAAKPAGTFTGKLAIMGQSWPETDRLAVCQ